MTARLIDGPYDGQTITIEIPTSLIAFPVRLDDGNYGQIHYALDSIHDADRKYLNTPKHYHYTSAFQDSQI